MKVRAKHNVFRSIRRPYLFELFLTFLCIFCISLSINSKEAFATSCFPTPDYFIKNVNPKISQPLIGETEAMKILDNTKKELEGYLDYQYMVFLPKWDSEKYGIGLCPFAKAIPIYLNEQLQYLPLVMKTKKKREFFKKCFNRPDLFISENFNPKKYFLAKIDYLATHINNYSQLQSVYSSEVFDSHSKRCKVRLTGSFIYSETYFDIPLFFEVDDIQIINSSFSKVQAYQKLKNIEHQVERQRQLACKGAIETVRLNNKVYSFWKTRYDFDAVRKVKKSGYKCGLSFAESEKNEVAYKNQMCECAAQRKKGTSNKTATYKKQFIKTCQQKVERFKFVCKGYND